jgi:hypothetical protein
MNVIHPIAETEATVTLARKDYEAIIEALEDAADIARIRASEQRVAQGEGENIPVEMVERMLTGESPIRVWREHRGITAKALSEASGVPRGYLSEIENGKKPGSITALKKLASALGVGLEDIA